jgi:4-amino-4-deoxy-L-arabinose transferase-like glycosyltransferase
MKARASLWWMVATLLVATALRLAAFGDVPPGLYHDEAYHGLDVLEILSGRFSLYFPANNGREPLFIYLIALTVGLLGKSPFALRLAAFPVGILTVAATMAMGKALFSRRVGVLGSAVLAVTLWHVHLSRVGFRAVLLPLFIALTVWQVALGIKGIARRRNQDQQISNLQSPISNPPSWRWHWILAGIFYGLSFYTYSAVRFTPVALGLFGLYVLATRPALRNPQFAIRNLLWRGVGLALLAFLLAITPLAAYTLNHPDVVLGRPGQVSVFNPTINKGDVWGTLGTHTLRTLAMFFVRGDRIWRHNVPWRPVFDPVLGAAFLVGLLVALRRAHRDAAAGFVLTWTALMSLPTLLAEDAPHFLRAVGVLPVVVLLPALGLDWLARSIKAQSPKPKAQVGRTAFLVLALSFGLVSTSRAYFGEYGSDPMAGYWFESGAAALAGRINAFLGQGWNGKQIIHGGPDEQLIYLDSVLWEEWQPQLRFLVARPEVLTAGLEEEPTSSLQSPTSDLPVAVFAWPYKDWQRVWDLLPTPAEITVEEGPLSQGDRDPKPFTTYLAFFATTPDPATPALARFSGGVELLGVEVTPVDEAAYPLRGEKGEVRVRLRWRANAPLIDNYTIFLHYLRDGLLSGQADSKPAGGHYPTTLWQPGDVVNDDHFVAGVGAPLPGHDVLRFGFWHPDGGAVLHLLDEAGNPMGDWIEVPVDG